MRDFSGFNHCQFEHTSWCKIMFVIANACNLCTVYEAKSRRADGRLGGLAGWFVGCTELIWLVCVCARERKRAHTIYMFAVGAIFLLLVPLCLYEIFFYFIFFCYRWMEWCVLCVYQTNYFNRSRSNSIVLYQKCISYACYNVIFYVINSHIAA